MGDGEFWEKGRRSGPKIVPKTHRYRLGLKMGPSAHCALPMIIVTSDFIEIKFQ